MLDYRTITFLTVCEEMNFTKAAQRLHISQPAVSLHIHHLEQYYGVRLFCFAGKKIKLTEEGRLLQQSLQMLHNNEIYLREQLLMLTDKKKTLHFGATLTVGEFMIAKPLSRFLAHNQNTDVTVLVANTKELLEKLDSGTIDFAILEGDYPRALYNHRPYIIADFIPVCGSSYIPASTPEKLSDLTRERLLLREPGSGTRRIFEEALQAQSIRLEDFSCLITIGNMNMIKEMAIAGCGITFLYETAVRRELESGALRRLELQGFPMTHEISIVWKKDSLFDIQFQEIFDELLSYQ